MRVETIKKLKVIINKVTNIIVLVVLEAIALYGLASVVVDSGFYSAQQVMVIALEHTILTFLIGLIIVTINTIVLSVYINKKILSHYIKAKLRKNVYPHLPTIAVSLLASFMGLFIFWGKINSVYAAENKVFANSIYMFVCLSDNPVLEARKLQNQPGFVERIKRASILQDTYLDLLGIGIATSISTDKLVNSNLESSNSRISAYCEGLWKHTY